MINLVEYAKTQTRLADYLPWACLIAPGVVLNKDGSFQRSAMFRGPDLDSSTQEELVSICARINNALKRFGSSWALYFEARREPSVSYPTSAWRDPVAELVDQERRAAFETPKENARDAQHFENSYYLTFAYLPPMDSVNKIEDLIIEKPEGEKKQMAADYLNRFLAETEKTLDLFASLLPHVRFLDDDETLTYLHGCISPNRHKVKTPDVPAYLDAIIGGADLVGGLEPMLGGEALRVLSIQGFPNTTQPGILDDLNRLGFEYRWTTRFLPMDKLEATKVLTRYRRQWFAKRKSIMSVVKEVMTNEASALVDTDADNKAYDTDAALQILGSDNVSFGYITTSIAIHHPDPLIADEMIRSIERVINGRGFVTIRETVNAVDAWLGTLPGNPYANVRQPIVHTLNLAHLMPLSAVWAGPAKNVHLDAPPLLYATTGAQTPFRLVLHQGDVGHTLIVGPTGAGKSVLLSLLALQFRRYEGAQVFIFDKGASARAATLGLGGEYYDLGNDGALAFQPLANIDQMSERAWALEWTISLLVNEGLEQSPELKDTVWSALNSLASAPKVERTMTGLSALLQSNEIRQALQPYTLDGAHGSLLDADNETLGDADVQCFEMEELMHNKALIVPVLTYLFHKLEARFNGQPTLLILDEAWVFLDDPVFAPRIREWLKVLRKKNVSVIFATQSLSDIASSQIAPALIESCPSRIFLPNDRAQEPQQCKIYEQFGLNPRQIEIVARATPKRDYYFQSRAGNRLFDLGLGPVALAFCASASKDDQEQMNIILKNGGKDQFASQWLSAHGLHWAANLLLETTPQPQTGETLCAAE
ncbi:MAG: conjugal transfer protein TrbE [Robiginitomaculum sp.]|nr:MAG: conjugal transfer protein TrbE [Robiginitomaculum sp.]